MAGDREYLYSLTLPELGETRWQPPPEASQGIPRFQQWPARPRATCGPGWPCGRLRPSGGMAPLWWGAARLEALRHSPDSFAHPRSLPAADAPADRGAPMTFLHPWLLLLVVLPVAWACWEWRAASRRGALLLKAGALAAVAAALAQPRLTVYENRVAVVMLADTSASISDRGPGRRIGAWLTRWRRARGRHWTRSHSLCPRHAEPRAPGALEEAAGNWPYGGRGGPRQPTWNRRMRDATAALPAGFVPRLRPGFRRQREPGQRHARHLAGPPARHPHRHRASGGPRPGRACSWNPCHFPARCSAESAFQWR